jgi:serine/threonine protein kinase
MIIKTLGNFTLEAQIGKGGMGEVYRAKDQKLGREVAIKVLPEEFAKDADRVARFQREAKLLASLNHPNIAAIYGLEESDGTHFLVLELIEGETLADRIKRGAIPVEESLKLALQIAEALEVAHEKGVIHRDLKPANIKVTPDGKVKVLDFGLAKAFAGDQAEVNLSNSPTLSEAATMQGVILGTAAYMSPEQAKGKTVDKRADIWAFGVVLFEMLTGKPVFPGEEVGEILASVIKGDAILSRLPENLHPRVHEVLSRCLQKDLKKRYQHVGDVRYEIEQAIAGPSGLLVQPITGAESRTKLRAIFPWAMGTLALGAIIAGVAVWKLNPPEPRQVTRFVHYLPDGQQFAIQAYPFLGISPDGRQIAYCATTGLFLRSMGEFDARRISAANESTSNPFFSPDGQWIGYCSNTDNKLKKVFIHGEGPVPLCEVASGQFVGAVWGADDMIVYNEREKGILRISASGGIPETLIPSKNEIFYHPRLLSDGETILFTLNTNEGYKIAVQSLKSQERKILFQGDCAWYLPTGHLVYALDYNLHAVPFNLGTLQPGASVPVIEGLFRQRPSYAPQYAVSASGTLVYLPKATDAPATERMLVWVDKMGKEEPLKLPPRLYRNPRISPDGKKVALDFESGGSQSIWIWDLHRENLTRLTRDAISDAMPLWTPDGQRILFLSSRRGADAIYSKAANGTGEVEKISVSLGSRYYYPFSWTDKNGNALLLGYAKKGSETDVDIGSLSMKGNRASNPLFSEKYNEFYPSISPDGKFLAYESNESGQDEVYVRSYPDVNKEKWKVSTSGGNEPLWSPDGRELFYRNADAIMAVSVKTEPAFSIEKPKMLFQAEFVRTDRGQSDINQWDISPDGKRFLILKEAPSTGKPAAPESPRKINVVLNWFEELKERVPVD